MKVLVIGLEYCHDCHDKRFHTRMAVEAEIPEETHALLRGVDALEYMLTASIMPEDFDVEALAAFGPEEAAGQVLPQPSFAASLLLSFLFCHLLALPLPLWLPLSY